MRALFRIRNARIYLLGDFVSTLGDSALWLAMAIWLKELTGSSGAAGMVFFAFALGSLFAPIGGVLADRFRRRPLLIWANLAGAGLVMLITLVHSRSQEWLIYLVIFLYGVIGGVISPAQTALLPRLVPEDLLAEANGAQQTLNQGLRLVAPLIGAGLFALAGGALVAEIDAATFLLAVVALLALRVEEPKPALARRRGGEPVAATPGGAAEHSSETRSFRAGFRFLVREPVLAPITTALAMSLLVFGFAESAGFSVVTVGLHHAATFIGVLLTVQGIGAVCGGLTAAPLLRHLSESMLTAAGLFLAAVGALLLTVPNLAVDLTAMVMLGCTLPWLIVAATTAIQRRTPTGIMGRVSGVFEVTLTVPQVLSIGVGAVLITVVSYRILLLTIAIVVSLAVVLLVSRPETRRRPARGGTADTTAPETGPAAESAGA